MVNKTTRNHIKAKNREFWWHQHEHLWRNTS